jgi:hypothetical protein
MPGSGGQFVNALDGPMPALFEGQGIRFAYPENWQLEEAQTEQGWSVTVQSPGTAFLLINIQKDRPGVQEVLDTTLSTLREDYPELEAEPASERIAGRPARGHDIQFFSLDLVNTCWTRCIRTNDRTLLILCQTNDLELEIAEPVLRAMRASIELSH